MASRYGRYGSPPGLSPMAPRLALGDYRYLRRAGRNAARCAPQGGFSSRQAYPVRSVRRSAHLQLSERPCNGGNIDLWSRGNVRYRTTRRMALGSLCFFGSLFVGRLSRLQPYLRWGALPERRTCGIGSGG